MTVVAAQASAAAKDISGAPKVGLVGTVASMAPAAQPPPRRGDEDVQRVESSGCGSRERQRQTLYAVSFPWEPSGPLVATVVKWWSQQTCGRYLLPRGLGERKVVIHSYWVVLYEEAEALFAAMLRSVSLGVQKAGRFQRVVEISKQDVPRRAVLPRYSIEQLRLTSVVSSPVDPVALIDGPKGGGQMVRLGDRVGKAGLRVVEIASDHVVFGGDGGKDGTTPTATEILRAVVSPGWEIGAGWVGTGR
jgi:hypothetical protein